MSDTTLRARIVRLAHSRPDLRPHLLPLLQKKGKSLHEKQFNDARMLSKVDPGIAKVMVISGNGGEDKVKVAKYTGSAAGLKPSQTTMVLGKSLGMALFMLKSGKVGGDLGAIISSDNHIMDGHHRWSAAILAGGSAATVGGYKAKVPGKYLVRILNLLTKGSFGRGRGKAGSGGLADYTPGKVRVMLEDFVENGIAGQFPWSPDDVRGVLESNFGSIEAGVEEISANAALVSKKVPSWAPNRVDMPVIDPEQVPRAVDKLQRGDVDWAPPYKQGAEDYKALLRQASTLPKGSKGHSILMGYLKNA